MIVSFVVNIKIMIDKILAFNNTMRCHEDTSGTFFILSW